MIVVCVGAERAFRVAVYSGPSGDDVDWRIVKGQ